MVFWEARLTEHHVLVIPSWYPSSADDPRGSFFREQAIALRREGCKVGVIAPQIKSLRSWRSLWEGGHDVQIDDDEGVWTYRRNLISWIPKLSGPRSVLYQRNGLKLFEIYRRRHGLPDIVHVQSALSAAGVAETILDRYGIPYVLNEHSTAFARNLIRGRALKCVRRWSMRAASCFAVSSPFAKLLDNSLDTTGLGWQVVPNSVDERFLRYPLAKYDKEQFTFGHVSFLTEKKCVDLLIRAFAREFKGVSNVMLAIGGDGPARPALQRLAQEEGVGEQVQFSGMLSRNGVAKLMAESDAFLLGSRYETFGVVLIEAMALGKPVVATRCGGPEDIVTAETGILVPVDNIDAFSAAIRTIYENKERYDASRIRDHCSALYSQKALAQRWKAIYADLLGPNKGYAGRSA